jgi:hypothetical protein
MSSPGNGRATDDPAANGTITLRTWAPTDGGGQTAGWLHGDWGPASTGSWDGNEFWLQMRMRFESVRRDADSNDGKISYISRTERSLTDQEIVTYYKNSTHFALYEAGSPEIVNKIAAVPHVWDVWATYLYHIIPGDENATNTTIEVWRAVQGETSWTKVFETFDETIDYRDTLRKAWNALICSAFHNPSEAMPEFTQKYDQIIFSKNTIPIPLT